MPRLRETGAVSCAVGTIEYSGDSDPPLLLVLRRTEAK